MKRLLLLVALVVACAKDPQLTHGRVVDKSYDDPDTYHTTVCVAYGQYGCSVWVPQTNTDPAHWKLQIRGTDGDEDIAEWHEVDETTYHDTEVGELWSKT